MTKTHPYPDLNISISDSGRCVEVFYSCPGPCKFVKCDYTPIPDVDSCVFCVDGDCRCNEAQVTALQAAIQQLKKIIKEIEATE